MINVSEYLGKTAVLPLITPLVQYAKQYVHNQMTSCNTRIPKIVELSAVTNCSFVTCQIFGIPFCLKMGFTKGGLISEGVFTFECSIANKRMSRKFD
jgi:hypothetical protein